MPDTQATTSSLKKWALAALASTLGLTLAEILCRLLIPAPPRVTIQSTPPPQALPAEVRLPVHPEQGGLYLETTSGRRLRPNTTALIERHALSGIPVEIRTNSLGHRNREPGKKNGLRILFLGDSITFADYLPEEQGYVRQVETIARGNGLAWETVNTGVGAVSLKTELAILLETGLALKPDVVVLGWYLNDFQDSRGVEVHHLPPLARRSRLIYSLSLMAGGGRVPAGRRAELPLEQWSLEWRRTVRPGLVGGVPELEPFLREVDHAFADWGGAWSPRAWEIMTPLLEEFVRLSRQHAFRPAWIAFPVRQQVESRADTSQPQQRLAGVARDLDVPLLDLLPVLKEQAAASSAPLFYDQCHHTAEASRIIAKSVVDWLRDEVLAN